MKKKVKQKISGTVAYDESQLSPGLAFGFKSDLDARVKAAEYFSRFKRVDDFVNVMLKEKDLQLIYCTAVLGFKVCHRALMKCDD